MRMIILILLLFVASPVARADNDVLTPYSSMTLAASGGIDQVIDPRTLKLADGMVIDLIGIDIPGLDETPPSPVAQQAYATIVQATKDARFKFYQPKTRDALPTRFNVPTGLLVDAKTGTSLQVTLLTLGLARVWFDNPHNLDLTPFLNAEEQARQQDLGLWTATSPDRNFAPEDLPITSLGNIAVVTGTIQTQMSLENTIYLVLSGDARKGFSLRIPAAQRTDFARAGLDLFSLQNKIIRARGRVIYGRGLMLDIQHPWQIEIISTSLPNDGLLGETLP